MGMLFLFIAVEIPVLFFQAASAFLMRRTPEAFPLQRLWALQFPLVALGGIGLPLWALARILRLGA